MDKNELPWTGERLVTSIFNYGAIDHLHRYAVATQLVKDKEVLDIASGEGYGSHLLSLHSKSVVGVDISSEAVLHASKKYESRKLEFKQGSTEKIPLPDSSIDVVVSFETIEHHNKHDEMLHEIKRVLRPNGTLIISSPDKLNYTDIPHYSNPFHVKELYKNEFLSLMKKYFTHTIFLNQKSVVGSLIVPDLGNFSFREFEGNYSKTVTYNDFQTPIYNLCIASDFPIAYSDASFFNGKDTTDYDTLALKNEITYLKNELGTFRKLRLHWVLTALRKMKFLAS